MSPSRRGVPLTGCSIDGNVVSTHCYSHIYARRGVPLIGMLFPRIVIPTYVQDGGVPLIGMLFPRIVIPTYMQIFTLYQLSDEILNGS